MSFAKYAQLYRENGFFSGSKIKATITDNSFIGQEMILSKGSTIIQTRTIPVTGMCEFFTDESGELTLSADNGTAIISGTVNVGAYGTYNVTVSGTASDTSRYMVADKNTVTIDDTTSSDTVKITYSGDVSSITANSTNRNIVSATVNGNEVNIVDAGSGIKGDANVNVTVAQTDKYDQKTITVIVHKTNGSIDKSWVGLKNMVNDGIEQDYCDVGEEYTVTLSNGTTLIYVLGAIDHDYDHQLIFVPKRYDYLTKMRLSETGANWGYKGSSLETYLNSTFMAMLPSDLQNVISNKTIQYATSNTALDSLTDKIWLPREMDILGECSESYPKEAEVYRIHQFPCFADKLITLGDTSKDYAFTMSRSKNGSINKYMVVVYGDYSIKSTQQNEYGYILPCFQIAKDS